MVVMCFLTSGKQLFAAAYALGAIMVLAYAYAYIFFLKHRATSKSKLLLANMSVGTKWMLFAIVVLGAIAIYVYGFVYVTEIW